MPIPFLTIKKDYCTYKEIQAFLDVWSRWQISLLTQIVMFEATFGALGMVDPNERLVWCKHGNSNVDTIGSSFK